MNRDLQPGDLCLECQQCGLKKYLKLFYINLDEQILKCENNCCMYPHTAELLADSSVNETTQSPLVNDFHNIEDIFVSIGSDLTNTDAKSDNVDDAKSNFCEAAGSSLTNDGASALKQAKKLSDLPSTQDICDTRLQSAANSLHTTGFDGNAGKRKECIKVMTTNKRKSNPYPLPKTSITRFTAAINKQCKKSKTITATVANVENNQELKSGMNVSEMVKFLRDKISAAKKNVDTTT